MIRTLAGVIYTATRYAHNAHWAANTTSPPSELLLRHGTATGGNGSEKDGPPARYPHNENYLDGLIRMQSRDLLYSAQMVNFKPLLRWARYIHENLI